MRNQRAWRDANRAFMRKVRADTVCAHCGRQPIDWHSPEHIERPTQRLGNMSARSRAAILAEIARCIPLCRSCHMREDGRLRQLLTASHQYRPPKPCGECGRLAKPLRTGLCATCYERYRARRRRAQARAK